MRYTKIVEISGRDIFKRNGQKKVFPAKHLIAERGLPATHVYFIERGQVRAFFLNTAGDEITLFYVNAGNMFCTESLVAHPTIIVSLDAVTDTEVYRMEPDQFLTLWFQAGYSVKDLLSHFVRRILLLSDYLCCTRLPNNEAKLSYFLYSMYMDGAEPILYSHEQIATMTGMSKVSVDRILKKLENCGALSCKYRRIKVVDPDALVSFFRSLGYLVD